MGPRSDNRGYGGRERAAPAGLGAASMGPWSDNRGYARVNRLGEALMILLQWVHGRITVVMMPEQVEQRRK